ncbi:MAG: Rieske (2Fe-2S) protein [Beutenbergiaceae bacterium]
MQPSATGSEGSDADSTASSAGGGVLANVADIPVGGALAVTSATGEDLLLTQPTEGEILAFSAVCTHQGCIVEPASGELACPCHHSVFDLATGQVLGGPAPEPLPAVPVAVAADGSIS